MVNFGLEVFSLTERLYYNDGHLARFVSRVVSCESCEGGFDVRLEGTAFFPGGGGQEADSGTLGGMRLLSLRETDEGDIAHILPGPLEPGAEVEGVLDWDVRFARMQSHSGEHIVSGTVHRLFGYDNVGFHMGESGMTLDFSGELTPRDIGLVELEANRAVWRDAPVRTLLPGRDELEKLDFRSKKELSGLVRLVEIEGVDLCACCAPHVSRTGEVGLIKVVDYMRHRGGMRLTVLAGEAAYRDCAEVYVQNSSISAALSAKRLETAAAVRRSLAERSEEHSALTALKKELMQLKSAALRPTEGNICIFERDMDMVSLGELVNSGMQLAGGGCAAFCGEDGGYRYIIGSLSADLRSAAGDINAALCGRGGGNKTMIQGSCRAKRADIEAYFAV